MSVAPKVSVASLVEALLPVIREEIALGIKDAMFVQSEGGEPASLGDIVSYAVEKAASEPKAGKGKRRKARKVSDLPAFPEGFVKDASFSWKNGTGKVGTHRITSIKDGVAFTRSLSGFKGQFKSTTIIAALQSKNVALIDPKASPSKDKARVTRSRKPKAA